VTLRPRLATGLPFSPWTSGLGGLSVFAGCELDRTCVHESVGKIQVVQMRRVLLLFALVLGLSALVATIAPAPEEDEEAPERESTVAAPAVTPPTDLSAPVRLPARARGAPSPTRRVEAGSSFSLEVSVREPGDVVIDDLGLRQTADPLTPARFDLLASPPGRHAVAFVPVRGGRRVIGRLAFVEPATVTPRQRDR
jgi:hypothetical protein